MDIYKVTTYTNEKSIEVKELINQANPIDFKYESDVMVPVGPGMAFPIHVEFPKEYNLLQCFENFNDCIKAEIEKKMQEERDRNLIIPASGVPPPDFKQKQAGFKLA